MVIPLDPALMDTFCQEVEQQVAVLNRSLLDLEAHADLSAPGLEALEALMRSAHSLKGTARMLELQPVVELTHRLEACFVAIQHQGSGLEPISTPLESTSAPLEPATALPPSGPPLQSREIDQFLAVVDWLEQLGKATAETLHPWLQSQATALETLQNQLKQFLIAHGSDSGLELSQSASVNPTASRSGPLSTRDPSALAQSGGEPIDRVVRVSADNLHRIISLAGESLVDANWLQPFADSLSQVKLAQQELAKTLEHLEREINHHFSHNPALEPNLPNQAVISYEHLIHAARHQEQQCRDLLDDRLSDLELYVRRSLNLSDRLYREVIHAHMRPFSDGVAGFPRMVRDLSQQVQKKVRFEVIGKATLVDRDILKKLEAPLTHILRNAIDHGIEPVAQRESLGKPPQGLIRLEALHRGGMLVISISDDGRGIDLEALRQKVCDRGWVTAEMAPKLSTQELLDFLFLPGFSTAPQVTDLSGRGVGLDVAKTMAEEVGGRVQVSSQQGQGTRFSFQLPLTLSVMRALLVQIGGEPYAFPLARVDQIVRIPATSVAWVEGRRFFHKDNQNIGLIPAHTILEVPSLNLSSTDLAVVVIQDRGQAYGLVVEDFLGEEDLVVRPLDPRLGRVRDISAVALLQNGNPVVIVDVGELVRSIDQYLSTHQGLPIGWDSYPTPHQGHCILVVDDSPTVRETQRRILVEQGYSVNQVGSGLEAWEALGEQPYDLVITDVDMPGMTGVELVRKIRNHSRFQSLPVIMVSYRDRPEDQALGLEAGANLYLTKSSFQDDTFLQAVHTLLGTA